jgi:8-oxo-dGTP pyrophosphatase MutT (NUDIX family)
MKIATLCYLFNDEYILLGSKKYGKAKGILNGFGGKVEDADKNIVDAVKREFYEETKVKIENPTLRSILIFNFENKDIIPIYLYFAEKWKGTPTDTQEMKVHWYKHNKVPVHKMWPGDKIWFPIVMSYKNTLINIYFKESDPDPQKIEIAFNVHLYENIHKETR